jgi:hypothetical protein
MSDEKDEGNLGSAGAPDAASHEQEEEEVDFEEETAEEPRSGSRANSEDARWAAEQSCYYPNLPLGPRLSQLSLRQRKPVCGEEEGVGLIRSGRRFEQRWGLWGGRGGISAPKSSRE